MHYVYIIYLVLNKYNPYTFSFIFYIYHPTIKILLKKSWFINSTAGTWCLWFSVEIYVHIILSFFSSLRIPINKSNIKIFLTPFWNINLELSRFPFCKKTEFYFLAWGSIKWSNTCMRSLFLCFGLWLTG